jgi:hypothetical protein
MIFPEIGDSGEVAHDFFAPTLDGQPLHKFREALINGHFE